MNRLSTILALWIFALAPSRTHGQEVRGADAAKDLEARSFEGHRPEYRGVPSFFEKEGTKGSLYLSRHWMYGMIRYADGSLSAKPDPYAYNYDKINNRLLVTRDGKNVRILPNDSVSNFALSDSNTVYLFEKIPLVNAQQFFQSVLKSDKGFCLYRRLITKVHEADFKSLGYTTTGKRYDEYVDYDEYYITFPGKRKFKKCYLKIRSIRKALRSEAKDVDDFLARDKEPLTEDVLTDLLRFLNDKIGCCTPT